MNETDPTVKRRRKAYRLAQEIGLTRTERMELAQAILWRDVESWEHLDDGQIGRLLDALEGFEKVVRLLQQRV